MMRALVRSVRVRVLSLAVLLDELLTLVDGRHYDDAQLFAYGEHCVACVAIAVDRLRVALAVDQVECVCALCHTSLLHVRVAMSIG